MKDKKKQQKEDKADGKRGNEIESLQGQGAKVRKLLKKKGIQSPSTDRAVRISRNLSLVPNEDVSTQAKKNAWILKMRDKYGIKPSQY